MRVNAYRFLTACFAVLLLNAGCISKKSSSFQSPDFTLKDLSGNTVSLSSYRGHVVLLDFWATWCGPCRMSIPEVEKFYQRHRSEGLVVLGMNMDDETADVFPVVKKEGMSYPVLLAANTDVPRTYELDGIPCFVLIDQNGKVVKRYDGYSPALPEEWELRYQQLTTKARA